MRSLILSLLLVTCIANAKEITTVGIGSTYGRALENAKQEALEQAASTFLMAERTAKNSAVTERIDQYNAGIIKTYRVTDYQYDNFGVYRVTIVADVVSKKDNSMYDKSSAEFQPKFKEFQERRVIVDRLDDIKTAISINMLKPEYTIGRDETIVSVDLSFSLQRKWVSDLKSFADVIDEKGSTQNNTYESIHGGIVSTLLGSNPAAALLVAAVGPETPPVKDEMMVCFAGRKQSFMHCQNVGVDFNKLPPTPTLVIVGITDTDKHVLYKQRLDLGLYEYVYPGDKSYHYFFKSYKKTFNQPALIVYDDESYVMRAKFRIENRIVKDITTIKATLQ
jgi:hypothetical protein